MSILQNTTRPGVNVAQLRAPLAGALAQTVTSKADLPKANYWLNIGYEVDSLLENNQTETKFIGLAMGIPLDTMVKLPTNQKNADFAAFQAARNNLHEQFMDVARTMAPGDEMIVARDPNTGVSIQLRRVGEALPDVQADESNRYAVKLGIGGIAA